MTGKLRIRKGSESVRIEDELGRAIHLYFEDDETRRRLTQRWTSAEAVAQAQRIARLLTDDEARTGDGRPLPEK